MSRNDFNSVYDCEHCVEVRVNNDHLTEQRKLSIIIFEFPNFIQIKLRDLNRYPFNYTARIDAGSFEFLKKQQCLDINYGDFKSQLIEMLQQNLRNEMLIKCESDGDKCKLIFYEKSRIKNLIFLIIDLLLTNQDEIFDEMNNSIQKLKDANALLENQLQVSRMKQHDYEENVKQLSAYNKRLAVELFKQVHKIEQLVPGLVMNFSNRVNKELLMLQRKLVKLKDDMMIVKQESELKCRSSARLANDLQNLRLECVENTKTIEGLRREGSHMQTLRHESDRMVMDLRQSLASKEKIICDLQKQIEVLKEDMQNATVIVAQKTSSNDELAKDLVQANQMLVNFNKHYDMQSKEVENLGSALNSKEKVIKEQAHKLNHILNEFEEYKSHYNIAYKQQMEHELFLANKRIEELEKQNRETTKLNGLLTKKLSAGSMINFDKM